MGEEDLTRAGVDAPIEPEILSAIDDTEGDSAERLDESIEQPAKVMRVGTMMKQLLDEVRAARPTAAYDARWGQEASWNANDFYGCKICIAFFRKDIFLRIKSLHFFRWSFSIYSHCTTKITTNSERNFCSVNRFLE